MAMDISANSTCLLTRKRRSQADHQLCIVTLTVPQHVAHAHTTEVAKGLCHNQHAFSHYMQVHAILQL